MDKEDTGLHSEPNFVSSNGMSGKQNDISHLYIMLWLENLNSFAVNHVSELYAILQHKKMTNMTTIYV